MPIFEISGKYTPEAHAAVRKAGHASREAIEREAKWSPPGSS